MNRQKYQQHSGISVLFLDIVGFTSETVAAQKRYVRLLAEAVLHSCGKVFSSAIAGQRSATSGYVTSSTGDGYVISLYDQSARTGIMLELAEKIQRELKDRKAAFGVRYGLNVGLGFLVVQDGVIVDVIGPCINYAHRVMSLGDDNHILMTRSYSEHVSHSCRLREYSDVRLDKGRNVRAKVFNYVSRKTGNSKTPYRILIGHINIEHAIEGVLDRVAAKVTACIQAISKEINQGSERHPNVRVTVLCYDPADGGRVWVTPHSRCNGKPAYANEHEFNIKEEGLFDSILNSIGPTKEEPPKFFIVGLPNPKTDPKAYRNALARRGKFKLRTVRKFSGKPRAFIYLPILHNHQVVGFLSVDSADPICENEESFKLHGDALRQCFDDELMYILGHCYKS